MLIRKKANPNVCNPTSYFTPLHWACVHGATDVVKLLLENHYNPASQYIPDHKGFYPLDYAGQFKHVETVRVLIKHHLEKIDGIRRTHQNEQQWEAFLGPYIDKNGRSGRYATVLDNPVMQFSPIFHTSVLYWAAMFNEIELSTIEEILTRLEAYPECPVAMDSWRTPCHAAAQVGNTEKLRVLMNDIYNRY